MEVVVKKPMPFVPGRLDQNGSEIPDPTPVAIPAGFKEPESLENMIRRLVRADDFRRAADQEGFETFEEAEDFEIDDDSFDPSSPYEEVFDPVLGRGITPAEFNANREVYLKRYLEADQRAYEEMLKSDALRARPKAPPRQEPKVEEKEKKE